MQSLLRVLRWTALGLAALAVGPLAITVGSLLYFSTSGVLLPDVRIAGVPVGGLPTEQAEALLERVWNEEYRVAAVDLQDPARAWVVQPVEFGLRVDAEASVARVRGLVREGTLGDRVRAMLQVLREGIDLAPQVTFDPQQAARAYERWADSLRRPAQDAQLIITGSGPEALPAQPGWRLDPTSSTELLAGDPAGFLVDQRMIPFVMQPFDAGRTDVSQARQRAQAWFDQPPVLRAYDPVTDERFSWSPGPAELSTWLLVAQDQSAVELQFDEQRVLEYVRRAGAELGGERELALEAGRDSLLDQLEGAQGELLVIRYLPTTYQVQPGDQWISLSFKIGMPYWKLQEANPALARRGLIPGETLILPPRDDMLSLPVVPAKRIVVDLSEQRMRVYQDGALLREHVISTGIPDSPTMPGIFQVSSHYLNAYASIWDLYMPHFMGIYDAVPGLTNGIHGLPLLSSGRRLWADVLGRPASFGCIILDLKAAEQLYEWAEDGVVVAIVE